MSGFCLPSARKRGLSPKGRGEADLTLSKFLSFQFNGSGRSGEKNNSRRGFDFGQRIPIGQNGEGSGNHYGSSGR